MRLFPFSVRNKEKDRTVAVPRSVKRKTHVDNNIPIILGIDVKRGAYKHWVGKVCRLFKGITVEIAGVKVVAQERGGPTCKGIFVFKGENEVVRRKGRHAKQNGTQNKQRTQQKLCLFHAVSPFFKNFRFRGQKFPLVHFYYSTGHFLCK